MDEVNAIAALSNSHSQVLALSQLTGEYAANIAPAVSTTIMKSQNVVYGRLDRIREVEMEMLTPPAAGSSGDEINRFWVGGFGVWADEDNNGAITGYDYSAGGVSLGYDRKVYSVPGLLVGVSGAFSKGDMDDKNGLTSADIDTIGVGVYGSYTIDNSVFVDASVGYARANNDVTTNLVLGGQATGSFDIDSWQFGVRGGAIIQNGGVQFIPSVGVRYSTIKQDAWIESVTGNAGTFVAHHFNKVSDHQVDVPVQMKINSTFQSGIGSFTPELRLGWTYTASKPDHLIDPAFVGANNSKRIAGIKARTNTFQAGAGIKINTGGVVDIFANYDLDAGDGYKNHNGSLGLGFEF
jgi:outer membrane autotransporter protein